MNTLTKPLGGLRTHQKDEAGFTLVELLVVILIIGILAAIAIPAFLNQRQRANDAAVESDAKNIATQIETMTIGAPNAKELSITSAEADGQVLGMAFINAAPTPSRAYADVVLSIDGVPVSEERFQLSDDVRIVANDDDLTDGYTFTATHDNGKSYNFSEDTWLLYDSLNGGIQEDAVAGDGSTSGEDEGNDGEAGDDPLEAAAEQAVREWVEQVNASDLPIPSNVEAFYYTNYAWSGGSRTVMYDGWLYLHDYEGNGSPSGMESAMDIGLHPSDSNIANATYYPNQNSVSFSWRTGALDDEGYDILGYGDISL